MGTNALYETGHRQGDSGCDLTIMDSLMMGIAVVRVLHRAYLSTSLPKPFDSTSLDNSSKNLKQIPQPQGSESDAFPQVERSFVALLGG